MINYKLQAQKLLSLANDLSIRGYKKKEIATILEIPAPVLSSLLKNILPIIANIDIDNEDVDERISYAFSLVNNMSANKTLQQFDEYITKLESSLNNNLIQKEELDYFSLIKKQSCNSFEYIKKYIEGLYDLYYITTDKYVVKKEPFWIRTNPIEKYVEVFKGNIKNTLRYRGIGIVTNNHTLTIQMAEINDMPNEYLMMHFTLPFTRRSEYMRGIFTAISYAREPIARKVVIRKINNFCSQDDYNHKETIFYTENIEPDIPEIHNFLKNDPQKIECISIPKPQFTISDLSKEIDISNKLKDVEIA